MLRLNTYEKSYVRSPNVSSGLTVIKWHWKVKSNINMSLMYQTFISQKGIGSRHTFRLLTGCHMWGLHLHLQIWPQVALTVKSNIIYISYPFISERSRVRDYYCTLLGSHIWRIQSRHQIWAWVTLKGQVRGHWSRSVDLVPKRYHWVDIKYVPPETQQNHCGHISASIWKLVCTSEEEMFA